MKPKVVVSPQRVCRSLSADVKKVAKDSTADWLGSTRSYSLTVSELYEEVQTESFLGATQNVQK